MAPVFPSKRIPPAHDATAKLRAAIVGGVFGPNERLVEEHLAEKFRTTRPAIRTALALLEQERLVVHERNRGARVRAVTPEEAEEILEARAALEALVARKAVENVDRAGIARLTAIVREMQEHQRNGNLAPFVTQITERSLSIPQRAHPGPTGEVATRAPGDPTGFREARSGRGGNRYAHAYRAHSCRHP